ncbi:hypothetical protein OIU76_019258 [Salix suchowensis]|nr:hypothetical protein OIU76_019258 [Salix suchowensis]
MDCKAFSSDYDLSLTGEHFQSEKNKKDVFTDDSFMIQARPLVDDQSDSQLRTDMSIAPDVLEATQYENGRTEILHDKSKALDVHEPDDLLHEWTLMAKKSGNPGKKVAGKDARSKVPNGSDIKSRTKKPTSASRTTLLKSKSEKEEEIRKRMEELSIERQKRIAERSAGGSGPATSKRIPARKVPTAISTKNEKPKTQSPSQDAKKPVIRSSTIDRLATARATPKLPSTESKAVPTQKGNLEGKCFITEGCWRWKYWSRLGPI